MFSLRSVCVSFFLLVSFLARSQYVVKVTASDKVIAGANIVCNSGFTGVSDEEGFLSIPSDVSGCLVTHIGYEPFQLPVSPSVDTLIISLTSISEVLPDVVVQGYQLPVRLSDIAGGYSYLAGETIKKFTIVNPVSAFNSLAGVRMEQRSPSSYRMNIRGSTLRSPFGVRNVKVYWNFIPLTEATGNTPLNMVDLASLGNIQIIRGPSGSLYGAGTGGVMLMENSFSQPETNLASASFSAGSYGLRQWGLNYSRKTKTDYVALNLSGIQADGYREHSESDRKTLSIAGASRINSNHELRYYLLYSDLYYQLPGGLTAEQFEADPRMARSVAVDQNSLIDQKYLIGGLESEWQGTKIDNRTSIFFSSSDKENPFITNYEFEDLRGAGLRTRFTFKPGSADTPWRIVTGGEWQWGRADAVNFGNIGGFPDTLRYSDENSQFTGFEFAQVSYERNGWNVTLSGSLNHLNYTFNRKRDAGLDSAYQLERSFKTMFSPRIGIVKNLGAFSVHASYSEGFSPPGLDEVRTSDAQINTMLESEEGRNFEIGLRGMTSNEKLTLDLNAFVSVLNNTIVSRIDENGTSTFQNSGKTRQNGIELMTGYRIHENWNGWFNYLFARTSITYYDFKFSEYSRAVGGDNVDFSGNELTGTPPFSASVWITSRMFSKVTMDLNYQHVSEIPLNDANTIYSDAYDIVQFRMSWTALKTPSSELEIFAGIDNLLNEKYSLGNDLNAFGGRYFNPAADRNFFAGIRLDLKN